MGKRRRARQITKPEDDEGPNIAKEIEEIKDPLQTLYKAANIKVKKETKSKIKENEEEKEISLPKYKEIHFRDDEIDTFTMHFEKDRLNNHLSSENKGFKTSKYSTQSHSLILISQPKALVQSEKTKDTIATNELLTTKFLINQRLNTPNVLKRVNILSGIKEDDQKFIKNSKYIETLSFMNSWLDFSYEFSSDSELKMLRSCYVFHTLNCILNQNEIISANDFSTRDKDELRQDNVFQLTKMIEGEGEGDDDNDESDEEDQEEIHQSVQRIK